MVDKTTSLNNRIDIFFIIEKQKIILKLKMKYN